MDDENLIVDATALTDLKTYLLNVCVLLFRTCTDSVLDSFDLAENSAALSSFVGNPDVMCLFVSLTRGGPSASGIVLNSFVLFLKCT